MVEITDDEPRTISPVIKYSAGGIIIVMAIILFIVYAIGQGHPTAKIVDGTTVSGNVDCKLLNRMPDMNCTPGIILAVPKDGLCSPTYTQPEVDNAVKLEVYKAYGITDIEGWDIQHWVPLELGGSNDMTNLYPMSIDQPGTVERSKAAKKLKELVCANTLPLSAAQQMIKKDWATNPGLYR